MFARRVAPAAVVVAGAMLFHGSIAAAESKAEKTQANLAVARLSMCDAIRIAEAQTGGRVYKAELKRKDGRVFYELELVLGGETVKTEVDALIVAEPSEARPAPTPPPAVRLRPVPPPRPLPPPRLVPPPAEAPALRPQPIQPEMMPGTPPASQPPSAALPPSGIVIPFDTEPVGSTPAGFTMAETSGAGKPAAWKITADDNAPSKPNVLAVTENANSPSTFSLLVANQPVLADVDTSTRVSVTGGSDGTSAGLAWRYQDPNNYYVAAYNKGENALDVWRVKDAKRKRIGTGVAESEAAAVPWHEIRVEMKGDKISAYLDGKKMVSERDFTFVEPGRVGFWANGDTLAEFDDLTVADLNAAGK